MQPNPDPYQQPYQAAPVQPQYQQQAPAQPYQQQPYQQQPYQQPYQQPATDPQGTPYPQGPAYQQPPAQPHYLQAQQSPAADVAKAARGKRNMVVGAIWFVVGVLITAITFASDSPVVVVTWGAIIGGAIQFVVGLVQVTRNR